MKELFLTSILDKISPIVPQPTLLRIARILEQELALCDMTPASTALVPYDQQSDKIRLFLVSKRLAGLASGSLEGYQRRLQHFLSACGKPVETIDAMDVRRYLAMYSSTGVKLSTLASAMTPLKSFFSWALDNGVVHNNPMNLVPAPKLPQPESQALSKEEMELLKLACRDKRDRALVEVYYSTGCRISELQTKNINDIDWNTGRMTVRGKGSKDRTVAIKGDAMVHLKRYLQDRKGTDLSLFACERAPYERMQTKAIQDVFRRLGKTAGIEKSIHPHLLRHTLATTMLRNGARIEDIQKFLGHADLKSTQRYAHGLMDDVFRSHAQHS